jgi:hypothetical protein
MLTAAFMCSFSVKPSSSSAGNDNLPATYGMSLPIKARALERTSRGRTLPS